MYIKVTSVAEATTARRLIICDFHGHSCIYLALCAAGCRILRGARALLAHRYVHAALVDRGRCSLIPHLALLARWQRPTANLAVIVVATARSDVFGRVGLLNWV